MCVCVSFRTFSNIFFVLRVGAGESVGVANCACDCTRHVCIKYHPHSCLPHTWEFRLEMEDPQGILCADAGRVGDLVTEKGLVASKEPAPHVQLACSAQYCAFPVDGNALCVWSTEDPLYQVFKNFCVFFVKSDDTESLAVACPFLGCCLGDSAPWGFQDQLWEKQKHCAYAGVLENKLPGITSLKKVLPQ